MKRGSIELLNVKSSLKVHKGDSIAVNGVCLTVVDEKEDMFSVEVGPETLKKTNIGLLKPGDMVNLETPLTFSKPIGGHIVQGHVDETGRIESIKKLGETFLMEVSFSSFYRDFLVPKGSVAIDGISLTVVEIKGNKFTVNIIPYTIANTNLKYRRIGEKVNIEYDIFAKYIFSFLKKMKF